MSYEAMDWAWECSGVTATQRLVLVALAKHVGAAGRECWPSSARLRAMTCLSERALRKALRDLEAIGLISCSPGSGKQPSRYRLNLGDSRGEGHDVPEGAACDTGEGGTRCRGEGHDVPPRGAPDAGQGGTTCPSGGHHVPPEPPGNPQGTLIEPSPNPPAPAHAEQSAKPPSSKQVLTATQQARFERFWQAYPRKVAKGEARKAWRQLDPDDELTDRICSALQQARQTEQWRREGGRYIPYPATWLRREGWEDQPEPEIEGLGGDSERVSATITNLQNLFGGSHG